MPVARRLQVVRQTPDRETWPMAARLAAELLRDPGDVTERNRCGRCGVAVLWARKQPEDGGGWHRPLIFDKFVTTVVDGIVYKVPGYLPHVCDSANVERFTEEKQTFTRRAAERYAERQAEWAEERRQRSTEYDQEQQRRMALELASLKYRCPDCLVEPDQMCLHLGKLKRGVHEVVKHPHPARQQLALDEHPELALPIGPSDRA